MIQINNLLTNNMALDFTAKAYVQDDLAILWDGTENVGWGTHDENATMLKDLSGHGKDLVWESGTDGVTFAPNHLALASGNKSSVFIASVDGITGLQPGMARTVEIVMSINWVFTDVQGNLQGPVTFYGAAYPCGRWNGHITPCIYTETELLAFPRTDITTYNWKIVSASIAQ